MASVVTHRKFVLLNGALITHPTLTTWLKKAGEVVLTRSTLNGLLMGTTLGGVTTERSYNEFGELRDEGAKFNNLPMYSLHYERDALGRITQKTEMVGGVATTFDYGYDLAGRLAEVKPGRVGEMPSHVLGFDPRLTRHFAHHQRRMMGEMVG